jgi:hypothetical protein
MQIAVCVTVLILGAVFYLPWLPWNFWARELDINIHHYLVRRPDSAAMCICRLVVRWKSGYVRIKISPYYLGRVYDMVMDE